MSFSQALRGTREDLSGSARSLLASAMAPTHRRFLYLLLGAFAVRLALAPLTAWGVDTDLFVISPVNMVYTGELYRSFTFVNPPLGPFLQYPLVRLTSYVQSPTDFVQYAPSLVGVSSQSGFLVPFLPTPLALTLVKLPLIASDLLVGVLLYWIGRRLSFSRPLLLAAGWLLNPLVLWASSVHAEVDTLAALMTLLFLVALWQRWAFPAGVFLSLGILGKLYPLAFLPFAIVWWLLPGPSSTYRSGRERWGPVGWFGVGAVVTILPFLPVGTGISQVLLRESGITAYGGLSALIAFNPILSPIGPSFPPVVGQAAVLAYQVSLGVAAVGSATLIALERGRDTAPSSRSALTRLTLCAAWCTSAALLASISPQSENVVALVPLLLLLAPLARPLFGWIAGGLSAVAWLLYLALLTPVAFFYPLAEVLGGPSVSSVNSTVLSYAMGKDPITQGEAWVVLGLLGGFLVLLVWAIGAAALIGPIRNRRERRSPPVPPPRPFPPLAKGRAARTVGVACLLVILFLSVESAALVATEESAPLSVSIVSATTGSAGTQVTLLMRAGNTGLPAHVGLLSGTLRTDRPVYVLADPRYPSDYASYAEILEVSSRIAAVAPLQRVDAAGVDSVVRSGIPSTLVVLGGIVPDSLLSNSSDLLGSWVRGGGLLVWAGGPLGFDEGHLSGSGTFVPDPMGWAGQVALAGYALTDPGAPGPLLGTNETAAASALGIRFLGTASGANETALGTHGGFAIGWSSASPRSSEGSRVSVAYLPVGSGGILFFGGSFRIPSPASGYIPGADFGLSSDLATLLGSGYVPEAGPSTASALWLASDAQQVVTLRLPAGAPAHAVAIATSPALPVPIVVWSAEIPSTAAPLAP